jgi:hypothetical protein
MAHAQHVPRKKLNAAEEPCSVMHPWDHHHRFALDHPPHRPLLVGLTSWLTKNLKTHGQQTYVAHLEGNSATSLAARRSQYLVLVREWHIVSSETGLLNRHSESQDLSLVMLRLRMGANGFLTNLQDYPITVQTTIKIDYDGGTVSLVLYPKYRV